MSKKNKDDEPRDISTTGEPTDACAKAEPDESAIAPLTKRARRLNSFESLMSAISGVAIVIMIAFVLLNIFSRWLFNYPFRGFYDITGLLGIIFYSFAMVYTAIKGGHISVKVVLNILPKKIRGKLRIIDQIIVAVTSLCIAYASLIRVIKTFGISDATTDLKIPLNPFRIVIVISFLCLVVLVSLGIEMAGKEDD